MAAIGRIRKNSGLLIAIIGVALAAFVLGDLFKSGGRGRQNIPVAVVNGEEITYPDFNRQAEQNLENQRQRSRTGDLSDRQRFTVRQQTYEQMVREILMEEKYDELGIQVTTEELYELVQGKNPHQVILNNFTDPNTNRFDPAMVRQFLANLDQMEKAQRQQWFALEEYIRDDRKFQKFQNLITKAYYVPDSLAKLNYQETGMTANVDYFGIKYQTIADDEVEVTDADYKNYYEENKYRFKNENEQRNLDYVVFDVTASEEDVAAIEEQVNELDEEFKTIPLHEVPRFVNSVSDQSYDSSWKSRGDLPARIESNMFNGETGEKVGPYVENEKYHIAKLIETTMRPDSMKASHILITYQGANRAQNVVRSRPEAQSFSDSLFNVLKNNPNRFEELAKEYSDGPTGAKGGDLGWFADGAMAYNFNEAVVNNDKGDVVTAETAFGYHIIKVTGKKDPVKKVRVAQIVREITPSSQTYQDVYMQASSFAGENKTLEQFEAAIEEQGLNKRSTGFFDKNKYAIPGITQPRQIVRWAFDEETEMGQASSVFEDEEKFIVAALTDTRPAGYIPVEDAKEQIEPLVRREKKAEVIIAKIEDKAGNLNAKAMGLGAEIKHYDNLRFNGRNLKGFGPESKVIARVFNLDERESSEPIQGDMAMYVFRMNSIVQPPAISNFKGTKESMQRTFERNAAMIYPAIKEQADIEDNTILVY